MHGTVLVYMNQSTITTFILGFLTSVMFALAFFAGQQHAPVETQTYENQQILLDSKIHLIEMKVDVITDQKDASELQSEYDNIMHVLEQSHQYTGEGIVARDQAMRAAASEINDAIAEGGKRLVEAIESLLDTLEEHLHSHEEEESEK
jgi:hypothetical protein